MRQPERLEPELRQLTEGPSAPSARKVRAAPHRLSMVAYGRSAVCADNALGASSLKPQPKNDQLSGLLGLGYRRWDH